jgi:hypothetical protein
MTEQHLCLCAFGLGINHAAIVTTHRQSCLRWQLEQRAS